MPSTTRPRHAAARVDRARHHSAVAAPAMSTDEFLVYLRRHPATAGLGRSLAAALDSVAPR